jgi:calcium-dependent protein kinase
MLRLAVHKSSGIERGILQKPFKIGSAEREALKKTILQEVARWNHPSVVRLIEVFEDENNLYFVTEALKGENVIENLWRQGAINEGTTANVIQQILAAVRYMHSKNVGHNQLNPHNIYHLNSGP